MRCEGKFSESDMKSRVPKDLHASFLEADDEFDREKLVPGLGSAFATALSLIKLFLPNVELRAEKLAEG
jgi:hypothetical protein